MVDQITRAIAVLRSITRILVKAEQIVRGEQSRHARIRAALDRYNRER